MTSFPGLRDQGWTEDALFRTRVSLFEACSIRHFASRPRMQPSTWWGGALGSLSIRVQRVTLRKVAGSRTVSRAAWICFVRQIGSVTVMRLHWFMTADHSEPLKVAEGQYRGEYNWINFARVDEHFLNPDTPCLSVRHSYPQLPTVTRCSCVDSVRLVQYLAPITKSPGQNSLISYGPLRRTADSYAQWSAEQLLSL